MPDAALRNRRFKLAVATSLVSKASATLVQIGALPLMAAALTADDFAAFLVIMAATQWVSLLGLGVLPSLTREIAVAASTDDHVKQRQLFGAGFLLSAALGLILQLGITALVLLFDLRGWLGLGDSISAGQANWAIMATFAIASIHFVASLSMPLRAGFQQSHITSVITTCANLLSFLAVLLVSWKQPGVGLFVLALQLPLTLLLLVDLRRICRLHPHMWPPAVPRRADLRTEPLRSLFTTAGSAWIVQLHNFLTLHGSVILTSIWFAPQASAAFGSAMKLVLIAFTVLGLFLFPLIPALSDAWARGDQPWVRRAYWRIMLLTLAIGTVFGLGFGIRGPEIMQLWLGGSTVWPAAMCAGLGLFFFAFSLGFVNFFVLLALGTAQGVGRWFMAEVVIGLALATLLKSHLGESSIAVALGLASLGVTAWLLPVKTLRLLSRPTSGAAG